MPWIKINGVRVQHHELRDFKPQSEFEKQVQHYALEWLSGQDTFIFHTSGSTGKPKEIVIERTKILASIEGTSRALGLTPGTTALLAMNPQFIGGRMMIFRALEIGMNLLALSPGSNPLTTVREPVHFTALVPLQIDSIMQHEASTNQLKSIEHVIIGGGALHHHWEKELCSFPNAIYQTYGMTETVSHIALKRISGADTADYYTALHGIMLDIDDRSCLIISGEVTGNKPLVTNDLVELLDTSRFRWLGRYDNVINTGGIKVQAEQLEKSITTVLAAAGMNHRLFVHKLPDQQLGEKIVLIIEGGHQEIEPIKNRLAQYLSRYEVPKQIIPTEQMILTASGKIDRQATLSQLGY